MRAVRVVSLDGPAAVEIAAVEEPSSDSGKVLVQVHAAGVTFPDLLMTRGRYQMKPQLPFTPGSEVAGIVLAAPAGAHVAVGDRVAAFSATGGFAEIAAAPVDWVFPLPDRLSFSAGAALPMNYLTMHFALVRRGQLRDGEAVLVHGAAGGVGTAAVQLARALGARVIAVVSTEQKAQVARAAGAHEAVLADGFLPAVKELTGGRGVDLVADPVGGDRFTDSLRSLATEGRLLVLGFTGGEIPTVKVNRLLLNNTAVIGVGWGEFALPKPGFVREQWAQLQPHLASGAIDPPLGAAYPLEQAGRALADMEERRATGKIVLLPRGT